MDTISWAEISRLVWGIVMALLAWIGIRLHSRQDSFDRRQREMEERISRKADITQIEGLQKDLKDLGKEFQSRLDNSLDRQTTMIVRLLKGKIND